MPMRECTKCNKVKSWPRNRPEPECHCKQGMNPPTVEKETEPEKKHFGGEGIEARKNMKRKHERSNEPETGTLLGVPPNPDGD